MGWKNWPSWVKGGLIGGIIGTIISIIITFNFMGRGLAGGITGGGGSFSPIWIIAAIMWSPPIILIFFGIGSLLGWLYGKIKKRSEK